VNNLDGDVTTPSAATPSAATLGAVAEAHGIATWYWSFFGQRVEVPAATLQLILRAMDVEIDSEDDAVAALAIAEAAPWRRLIPPAQVVQEGGADVVVHLPSGHDLRLAVVLEDGTRRDLSVPDADEETRVVDGVTVRRVRVPLPADLPLGWHELHATESTTGDDVRSETGVLVVSPARLPLPRGRGDRAWGVMAQLYSVPSRRSWGGLGDFADLADLAAVTGARGADFVLINPIHAAEVTSPIEPSPYLPATRRYVSALYVRPEHIREAAYLRPEDRARFEDARCRLAAASETGALIDRDAVWSAKRDALEIVFSAPRTAARQQSLDAFRDREGQQLTDFALWCTVQEYAAQEYAAQEYAAREATQGGEGADLDELRDIHSPLVARLREERADRVEFFAWLQWVADEQLGEAQTAAKESGMSIGVMLDLAVGVHPLGSDPWSLRAAFANGVSVGAPPDMYNQQGQNWHQPPWLPHQLQRSGYAPLRDLVRALLRHSGALRIDHIMGFFRLWWIPDGLSADAGTYVRYDHEAMIGVLALEAHRAGAVIIGEDLGNVEPWVRDYLAARGILGTSVLWFESDDNGPLPPERYRDAALATITTHDLPPTAGYLAGEHVELRARLGLLAESVEEARSHAVWERERMFGVLRERGLIGDAPSEPEAVIALHRYVASSPARLVGVSLADAVGERRAQNQPGTSTEYANWRVPLADGRGDVVLLDDLAANERFGSLTAAVDAAIGGHRG
jgi:4-alpha-glucanotransferase